MRPRGPRASTCSVSHTSGLAHSAALGSSSKTARDRLSRALWAIAQWCQQHRHAPVSWQHAVLSRKLRGHYSYYGITGNSAALTRFRHEVRKRWWKWLRRRGGRYLSWLHFLRLEGRYPLPAALAVQSS